MFHKLVNIEWGMFLAENDVLPIAFQESMSSAETPNHKRMSLSNSFGEDQGYHGGIPEHDGQYLGL